MIVPELSFGIKAKSCLKLLNRLQSTIAVLIGATQQYVCQCCGRLHLDCHFEFIRCGCGLVFGQEYKRQAKMNVEAFSI